MIIARSNVRFLTAMRERRVPGVRPWWGIEDAILAVPFVLFTVLLATVIISLVAQQFGVDVNGTAIPPVVMVFGLVAQQSAQFGYPWLVSKFKGLGISKDWGFRFERGDLLKGLAVGGLCFAGALAASILTAAIASLPEDASPSNTEILTDNQGTIWIWAIIIMVTIGAPISEEILFRGLLQRTISQLMRPEFSIVITALLFTLVHVQGPKSFSENLVLLSGLFVVGLVLGISAHRFNRLGPAIIGHAVFNLTGTVLSLQIFN